MCSTKTISWLLRIWKNTQDNYFIESGCARLLCPVQAEAWYEKTNKSSLKQELESILKSEDATQFDNINVQSL